MKKKLFAFILCVFTIAITGTACATEEVTKESVLENGEVANAPVIAQEYEAEDAVLSGNAKIEKSISDFSGTGYITGIEEDGDKCEFSMEIEDTGFYDLNFITASITGDYKANFVLLDDTNIGTIESQSKELSDSIIKRVYLEAGTHKVAVEKSWGWIRLDKLQLIKAEELSKDIYDIPAKLVNENADDSAKRLMSYLCDIYGDSFLSGQYCPTGLYGHETACVWSASGGKFPAVIGLDFIENSPSRVANGSTSNVTQYAIECWDKGGIVTFCWHWNVPEKYLTGIWWNGFRTEATNIDLEAIMNGEDPEGYDLLMSDIDVIAEELKVLQDAGVPVLWRPLHEASGGWFWWGASGSEAYKKLYIAMYDRLTNVHGLNNLIWLWNGQDADWYPGDEYVDIIGEDIYPGEQVYTSQMDRYMKAIEYTDAKKMIVLSENGCMFDPDLAIRDGAMWGFFAVWGGEFVSATADLNIWSDQYTQEDMVKKVYNHEKVITLDELPDLKTYEIRKDAN